jgi:hypothetical protein
MLVVIIKVLVVSANGKLNATKGMLPRVTFRIGEIQLPCPVQVIEEAPFEVLLGRPFTALAEANIQEFRNGEMHVTLKDPNTGLVHIHIPQNCVSRECCTLNQFKHPVN